MESIKTKSYPLDGKQVQLSKKDNRLVIEVEDQINGKMFSSEFDNDAIIQVSNEIFSDVNAMYQGLEDALKNLYKEVTLSFDDFGFLTYKVFFTVGSLKKEHLFCISLQEKRADSQVANECSLENKLTQILNKITDLEMNVCTRLNKLEERMTRLEEQKIDKQENNDVYEALSRLEKKISDLVQPSEKQYQNAKEPLEKGLTFDTLCLKAQIFRITNNSKTIENLKVCEGYAELPFSQVIPSSGTFQVNIRLEELSRCMWFGVLATDRLDDKNFFLKSTFYEVGDGSIRVNNTIAKKVQCSNLPLPNVGDVIGMTFNADVGYISFSVNGFVCNSIAFSFGGKKYVPYWGFYPTGGKVSII